MDLKAHLRNGVCLFLWKDLNRSKDSLLMVIEMNYELTRVTSKGQCTLPKEIRDKLKIKEGSLLAFYADRAKGTAIVKKIEIGDAEKEFKKLHSWGVDFMKDKPRMNLKQINAMIHELRG